MALISGRLEPRDLSDIIARGMSQRPNREQWLRDIEERQRNVVFPDTVQNEARFWRNLQDSPRKALTTIGLAVLAIFVASYLTVFSVATIQAHKFWAFVLAALLVWGPIFAAITLATRRTLRNIEKSRRIPRQPNHRL